ncbi:urea transporter [Escherichia coli]
MGHPEILYFSAISTALSPFFAWCLRYPDEEINEGIWGYNAVLYGIACGMLVPVACLSLCQSPELLYLLSEHWRCSF